MFSSIAAHRSASIDFELADAANWKVHSSQSLSSPVNIGALPIVGVSTSGAVALSASRLVSSCPAQHSQIWPALFRLEYCFVLRRTLCSVATGCFNGTLPSPPSVWRRIPSIHSRLRCYSQFPISTASLNPRYADTPVASRPVTRSLVKVTNCRCRPVWMSFHSAQRQDMLLRVFRSTLRGSISQLVKL